MDAAKVERQFEAVVLENDELRCTIIPALGGKMSSLVRKETGREFLLQSSSPLRTAQPGDSFETQWPSGFDECFPTVEPCKQPAGEYSGTALGDHGELWSCPWDYEMRDRELRLAVHGSVLPYQFRKTVCLEGTSVRMDYEVENRGNAAFAYLWSAHPLLQVETGCRILLPSEIRNLFVNWSSEQYLGVFGDSCSWPLAMVGGNAEDVSVLSSAESGRAAKLFAVPEFEGIAGLHYPSSNETLSFYFDLRKTPHLGVWICEGGWPSPTGGQFTVALEPSNGRPDSLEKAYAAGECPMLAPRETKRWSMQMRAERGTPDLLQVR